MRNLALYLRENTYRFVRDTPDGDGRGEIPEEGLDAFLASGRPRRVALVVAKPRVFFRRMSFPFSDVRKISMVLPGEMEDLMPVAPERLVHSWYFIRRGAAAAEVMVTALDREFHDAWRERARRFGFRLSVSVDALLVHALFRYRVRVPDYTLIYADSGCVLLNIVEGNALVNCYSYLFADGDELAATAPAFREVLAGRRQPVFLYGNPGTIERLGVDGETVSLPAAPPGGEDAFILPAAAALRLPEEARVSFRTGPRELPVSPADAALVLALCALGLAAFSPRLKLAAERRRYDAVVDGMHRSFRQAVPDAVRIVDPLSQIKERIRESAREDPRLPQAAAVMPTMAALTEAVPDGLPLEISQFVLNGKRLFVAGKVQTLRDLDRVKTALSRTSAFADVEIGDITFDGDRRVDFTLTAQLP